VWLSYLLARTLGSSVVAASVVALAVSLSPAVSSQVTQTMLDLPLMFFLLLHLWLLSSSDARNKSKSHQSYQWIKLVGAGIALGAFAAVKFPLFVPVVVVADCVFFWKSRQLRQAVILFCIAGVTFLSTYAQYFLSGHSLLEWVRSLYWTVQFYLAGTSSHPVGQVIPAVLFGQFQESTQKTLVLDAIETTQKNSLQLAKVREWSLAWSVGLLGAGWVLVRQLGLVLRQVSGRKNPASAQKNLTSVQLLVTTLSACYLALLFFVDFKARYFFPLTPVLLALCASVFFAVQKNAQQTRYRLRVILVSAVGLLLVSFQYVAFWHSSPTEIVKEIERTWNARNYLDLYSFILPGSTGVSREEFQHVLATQVDQNLQVVEWKILVAPLPLDRTSIFSQQWPVEVSLVLESSEFSISKTAHTQLVKHQGQWFLEWDWQWYLDNFDASCRVSTSLANDTSTGALVTSDGVVLSEYEPVENLRLVTENLTADDTTITALMPLTNNEYLRAQNFLLNTVRGREWYDFAFTTSSMSELQRAVFPERQGVWIKLERRKNVSLSETQREQVDQLEAEYPELSAQAEVRIELECVSGEYTVVIPGLRKNVRLTESFAEVFQDNSSGTE
jgi:hypothetical protein